MPPSSHRTRPNLREAGVGAGRSPDLLDILATTR